MDSTLNRNEVGPGHRKPTPPGAASEGLVCPKCGEGRIEHLVWTAIDRVRCSTCGTGFCAWLDRED